MLASPDLAPYIHHYGSVHWDLRSPYSAETLQHPAARIELHTRQRGCRAEVVGVRTERYGKSLSGAGRFFVVQFRPATFQPLLRAAVSSLTNHTLPAARVLGASVDGWIKALRRAQSLEREVEATEAFLRALLPPMPPSVAKLRDLVERIATDPEICRVEQLAAAADLDVRTLQRRFRTYVGVHPKWVIQRYRLLEAAQQLKAATPVRLAELAATLGYADQAHFIRDFRRIVGSPPGAFAHSAPPR